MTVKELMTELEKLDREATVHLEVVSHCDAGSASMRGVLAEVLETDRDEPDLESKHIHLLGGF